MAMIKEKHKEKCGSANKKGRNNSGSTTAAAANSIAAITTTSAIGTTTTTITTVTTTVTSTDVDLLKNECLENDIEIKDESFGTIGEEIMEKVSTDSSPGPIACSFTDSNKFAMDMCPVDAKLDGNSFLSNNLPACKSQVKTEDIISANADFSPDFMLDGPLSSCKPHKTDDVISSDPVFPPDTCDGMLPSIPMPMGPANSIVDSVPSLGGNGSSGNVVNKQQLSATMDAQYMQTQSSVFVFSTKMANESADAVMKGHFKNIIAYHYAQPKTKEYLEKHPIKMSQFNRQNSNQWVNNFAPQMRPKLMGIGGVRCGAVVKGLRHNPMMRPDTMNQPTGGPMMGGMNVPPQRLPMWNQQGNMNPMNVNNGNNQHVSMMNPMCGGNMMSGGPIGPGGMQAMNSVLPGQMGPNSGGMMHSGVPMKCPPQPGPMGMMSDASNADQLLSNNVLPPLGSFPDDQFPLSSHASTLTGVKVPDENLTLQQRLRREDKMATLRKIGEILLPENHQQSSSHHALNAELPPASHSQLNVDDISSVLGTAAGPGPGPGSGGNGGDAAGDMPMQKTGNNASGPPVANPMVGDWQKMPPFFDDRKQRMPPSDVAGRCGSRSQGPPPPYHQTTRSASVPIAVPSPNPNSPRDATSNLSLPSPRTCSGLNSPASKQGPGPSPTTNQLNTSIESPGQSHNRGINVSNPGTPVSSSTHLSPNSKQKDGKICGGPLPNEFSPASGQQSPDGISFCRSLQTLAARNQQQKQQPQLPHTQQMQSANSHCKEAPNLMPVPSPQHIQYLNTFEGQELTIQKQPNTSLKDSTSIVSPSLSNTAALDNMIPVSSENSCSKVSVSAPNTPLTPSSLDMASSKYPGTPADFTALSPNSGDAKSQLRLPPNTNQQQQQLKNDLRFPCSSPQLMDSQQQRFQPTTATATTSAAPGFMSQNSKNAFLDISSPEKMSSCGLGGGPDGKEPPLGSCVGGNGPPFQRMVPNNVPIDPSGAPKPPFDPISSLAQMSQQLTNNVPGSPGNQVGMMHSSMMYQSQGHMPGGPPNSMNIMQMNEMGMCGGGGGNTDGPMPDGGRMVFNSQMPPGMNMGPMGGNNVPLNRMMQCGNPNDGGGSKPVNMPGPYPMAGNGPPGPPQRMMRPPGSMPPNSYNGANIQVKTNTPHTIQYLPNRTQVTNVGGARGPPPSMDFLRYQNQNPNIPPNMEGKMQPNMNYFPNNYPSGPGGPPGQMNELIGNCGMPPGQMMRPPMRGIAPQSGPGGPPAGGPGMIRMTGNAGNMGMPPYNEQMYPPGGPNAPPPNMPNSNCHVFMPNQGGPKMGGAGPQGMGPNRSGPNIPPPDASQPLPPSMGQGNNFRNTSFMDPIMTDPQYQQQYHNFQQQLYATTTRSQMNSQTMNAAPSNQQYFVPK